MADDKLKVDIDFWWPTAFLLCFFLAANTSMCGTTSQERQQKSIALCLEKGGVPIYNWFDSERLSGCDFDRR